MRRRAAGRDLLRRLYGAVLHLYPGGFHSRYAADLLQAFEDRRRERRFRGAVGTLRLILFLLRDLAVSVPRAYRLEPSFHPSPIMSDFLRDLRHSVRMLVKNPAFTAAAVLTLALGIGLNAATFSAIHGILLRPLAGAEEPEELVQIYRSWPGLPYGSNSVPHFQDLQDRTHEVFEQVAAWYFAQMSLSVDGRNERLMGMLVSANFFQTFGADMAVGRAFIPDEESTGPGAHPVAILGHDFWRSRFGGDPDVVGSTITLNGQPFQVVGITSREFDGPVNFASPPIYVPLMMQPVIEPGANRLEARGNNMMSVVARLRDGQTVDAARERLDALLVQLREESSNYDQQVGHTLVLQNDAGIHPMFRNAQVAMSSVIMAVVALLLLIACLNVANLFLARARERRREMGIRLSLGAGRRRIIQQLLTESLVFSLVAGLAGLGLGYVAVGFLGRIRPPIDGPWTFDVGMDGTVLAFTLLVSVAAGVLFGLAPALQAARPDTVSAVKGEATDRPGGSRMSSGLVVAQMAISLILLISSGLFLRSLQGATRIDPGFDEPRSLVMASVDPSLQGYGEARSRAFHDRFLQEVQALPEVTAAGLTTYLPLGLSSSDRGVDIPGYEFAEGERTTVLYTMVTEGFFEAMGIDVLEGRGITSGDDEAGPPVLVVNRRFSERFWPDGSAVGRTVRTAGADRVIVGVVETGKYRSLGEDPTEFMYLPLRQVYTPAVAAVARAPTDPGTALGRIREIVREADPDLPLYDVRTMEDHMGVALLPARLGGSVLGLFGLLGLTLAAVGIYGVMAYSVSRRRKEMGIRAALGADRGRVVRMVLGEGLKLALLGTVLGLAGAALAARFVSGLLYGVSATDPLAFTGVPLLLLIVAATAVYLPARRAARADPAEALKGQ